MAVKGQINSEFDAIDCAKDIYKTINQSKSYDGLDAYKEGYKIIAINAPNSKYYQEDSVVVTLNVLFFLIYGCLASELKKEASPINGIVLSKRVRDMFAKEFESMEPISQEFLENELAEELKGRPADKQVFKCLHPIVTDNGKLHTGIEQEPEKSDINLTKK